MAVESYSYSSASLDRHKPGREPEPVAPRPSPFIRIDVSAKELADLETHLGNLASRLTGSLPTGSLPTGGEAGAPAPEPAGLFDGLDRTSAQMSARIGRMHETISRIEARLP